MPTTDDLRSSNSDNDESFAIRLALTARRCPMCGGTAIEDSCEHCAAEIPDDAEVIDLAAAREAALRPLAVEARDQADSYEQLPSPCIALTVDQFVSSFGELDVFGFVGPTIDFGPLLSRLDLNDPKIIGGEARAVSVEHLSHLREMREAVEELSSFAVEEPGAELRQLAIDTGQWGARIAQRTLAMLSATDAAAVDDERWHLEKLLGPSSLAERIGDLELRLPEWEIPDDNARIGLVLGRSGDFTDEFGVIDPLQIAASFSAEACGLQAMAESARRYFDHLLPGAEITGAESLLVLSAVNVASLDRPLMAHRLARRVTELMDRAWMQDPEGVQALAVRAVDEGNAIFAATSRVLKAHRLLMSGMEAGHADDEVFVAGLLTAYSEIAESSYRVLGWTVIDLVAIARGGAIPPAEQPPTLGPLVQRLEASLDPAANLLADVPDVALRNAVAHSRYAWDQDGEEVVDTRSKQRWSIDELQHRSYALISAVSGIDAALSCFVVGHDLEIAMPRWARPTPSGSAGPVIEVLATMCFGSSGCRVVAVEDGGATIRLEPPEDLDTTRLLTGLVALSNHTEGAKSLRIVGADADSTLLEVDADALIEARDAPQLTKNLATIGVMLSVLRHSGQDEDEALLSVAALQAKAFAFTAMQDLSQDQSAATLKRLRKRAAYIREFWAANRANKQPEANHVVGRLTRLEAAIVALAKGDQRALTRLVDQLGCLFRWAEACDISWPPGQFRADDRADL